MNDEKPVAKGSTRRQDEPDHATERVGTHSLGTSTGAAGGAAAGAVAGLAAGPVGALAGAVGGAVLGGAAGASTGGAHAIDTAPFEAYWRDHFAGRPYARGARYEDYEPAYRYAIESYVHTDRARDWDEVEPELKADWDDHKGSSRLDWVDVREAARDAWNRMHDPQDDDAGETPRNA